MVLSGAKVPKRVLPGPWRIGQKELLKILSNFTILRNRIFKFWFTFHFGNFGSGEPAFFPLSNHWYLAHQVAPPRGEGGTKSHLQRGAVFHRDPKTWFQDVPRPGGSTDGREVHFFGGWTWPFCCGFMGFQCWVWKRHHLSFWKSCGAASSQNHKGWLVGEVIPK